MPTSAPCRCAHLAGLAVLFVVAAGAAVVYGRVQSGADARDAAQADARFAARLAAREIGQGITVLQQTVQGAAANPGIAKAFASPEDCGPAVRRHRRLHDRASGPGAGRRHRRVLVPGASARARVRERRVAQARARRAAPARPRHRPAHERADRAHDRARPKLGFVLASFNLDAVGLSLGENYGGPRGLEFVLADAKGTTVLTRSIAPERWIASRHPK